MQLPEIKRRDLCTSTYSAAQAADLDELVCRIIAGRVTDTDGNFEPFLQPSLANLDAPDGLPDIERASLRLVKAITNAEKIGIVTDYDVDGITSHTLIRESLTQDFGVDESLVTGFIGHRLTEGYGLSSPVCERVMAVAPAVVITADCGSSDEPRIRKLKEAGIDVIVTDHHGLPDEGPPASAFATVSPARPGSAYPDAAIAGCAVAWLLMCVVRNELVKSKILPGDAPKLTRHLDLVSLGTVADAVSLFSANNRALVEAGLAIMNRKERPCWQAMSALLSDFERPFTVSDLGFQIGPRINARGRMDDPFAAWHFLAAADLDTARSGLMILDQNNLERRATEKIMVTQARSDVSETLTDDQQVIVIYHDDFHAGVQGIVASRLVDSYGRVSCVMSPATEPGQITGSLRSVAGVDVGAALRAIHRENPGILHRFGGHRAAAGVTIGAQHLDTFTEALSSQVRSQVGDTRLLPVIFTDGELAEDQISLSGWQLMQSLAPYGRGFELPQFDGVFKVVGVRPVGSDPVHLSFNLHTGRQAVRGIWFNALEKAGAPVPVTAGSQIHCVYELQRDSYRGGDAMQLLIRHAQPA